MGSQPSDRSTPSITTDEVARRVSGRLVGPGDLSIEGVNSLDEAAAGEITFISRPSFARRWPESRATAAVVDEDLDVPGHDPEHRALIFVPSAELAMIDLLAHFQPESARPEPGVHPTAWVHPGATIGDGARIGPHVSVDAGCRIGSNVTLHGGVRLSRDVQVGDDCEIHANCVIRERCTVGHRVVLHPQVAIGADGFGYRPAPDGSGLLKVPQIGTVCIEDDVEIGAGTCIDRGKFGATTIGRGTKIDNLVQIGHNCRIGQHCVIAGLTGLAGSVTIGDGAILGGMVGVSSHVTIGAGATIAGKSGISRDVPPGETWCWFPASPISSAMRQWAAIRRLPQRLGKAGDDRAE